MNKTQHPDLLRHLARAGQSRPPGGVHKSVVQVDGVWVLSEERAIRFLIDIITGLHYCHTNKVAHRDIKPENILVDGKGVAKLCDFGVSSQFGDVGGAEVSDVEGTFQFMAPECMTGAPFNAFAADIWAVGVTLYVSHTRARTHTRARARARIARAVLDDGSGDGSALASQVQNRSRKNRECESGLSNPTSIVVPPFPPTDR